MGGGPYVDGRLTWEEERRVGDLEAFLRTLGEGEAEVDAVADRVKAVAERVEAVADRVEAVAVRIKAVADGVEPSQEDSVAVKEEEVESRGEGDGVAADKDDHEPAGDGGDGSQREIAPRCAAGVRGETQANDDDDLKGKASVSHVESH